MGPTTALNNDGEIRAPIALFTYDRLWHTSETIEALKRNYLAEESELFVFSDGPKFEDSASLSKVLRVRKYLKTITGFKSISIIESLDNYGLAKSIIDGVTSMCDKYGKVIVMEDDLVTSPYFLKYMNDALNFYEDDDRVISIHGYIYPVQEKLPSTFFLRGADCWGWATWKRGWDIFEADAQKLYDEISASGEVKTFDFDDSYAYAGMLRQQIEGKVSSWAIRWYASAFLANKLTLYPGVSLVHNIGNDGSGTHCSDTMSFAGNISASQIPIGDISVAANADAYRIVSRYFKSLEPSMLKRVKSKLNTLRKRLTSML